MGLARLTTSQSNYVKQSEGGVLPVRWMAPETLMAHGVYTEASDVWAFGVCGMCECTFASIMKFVTETWECVDGIFGAL